MAESLKHLMESLESRRLKLEDYLAGTQKDLATLEGEFADEGRRRVANTLVLNAIAAEQGITVSEEDLEQEIQQRAFPVPARNVVVDFATLGGDAGYIGSAGIARLEHRRRAASGPRSEASGPPSG